jgi:hypothetical protein
VAVMATVRPVSIEHTGIGLYLKLVQLIVGNFCLDASKKCFLVVLE